MKMMVGACSRAMTKSSRTIRLPGRCGCSPGVAKRILVAMAQRAQTWPSPMYFWTSSPPETRMKPGHSRSKSHRGAWFVPYPLVIEISIFDEHHSTPTLIQLVSRFSPMPSEAADSSWCGAPLRGPAASFRCREDHKGELPSHGRSVTSAVDLQILLWIKTTPLGAW